MNRASDHPDHDFTLVNRVVRNKDHKGLFTFNQRPVGSYLLLSNQSAAVLLAVFQSCVPPAVRPLVFPSDRVQLSPVPGPLGMRSGSIAEKVETP